MILLDVTCHARMHDTKYARRRHGCVCPPALERPTAERQRRRTWRPEYIHGGRANIRGPRRKTVTEPDWAAVERYLSGDRSLVLAAVERDEAIDRLDRRGLSAAQIAIRLGVTRRTVQRRRSARRRQRAEAA